MSTHSRPRHIVAIDDAPEILDLFRDLLEDEGYRVTTQPDVGDGLEEIERLEPDVLVLDYKLARKDAGWSLLQALRINPRTAKVPVVLCTGAVAEVAALAPDLAELGVRVVLKPFDLDHLLGEVEAALAPHQTEA